ncbi:MAG TPA: hypothetical protein VGJ74_18885 [Burkholderiales bacterium]|jgi:hypothetical protein
MEFEIDPLSGRYIKRRLNAENKFLGYAGFGQELKVSGLGTVLCAVFLHQGEIVLRVGNQAWNLFEPGLEITHREGLWRCELAVREPNGKSAIFRYRRTDVFLLILDSAYDDLDFELANYPAALPSLAERKKEELIADWSARSVQPTVPAS